MATLLHMLKTLSQWLLEIGLQILYLTQSKMSCLPKFHYRMHLQISRVWNPFN